MTRYLIRHLFQQIKTCFVARCEHQEIQLFCIEYVLYILLLATKTFQFSRYNGLKQKTLKEISAVSDLHVPY